MALIRSEAIMKINPVEHHADGRSMITAYHKGVPYIIVIDTEDYPKVQAFCWNVKPDYSSAHGLLYAYTTSKTIRMHHLIAGKGCDHENHDGLDNRKQNLRQATKHQQAYNRRKRTGNYTSLFKGVFFHKRSNKWIAKLNSNHIGYFKTETAAAFAYNAKAIIEQGEFAVLNQIGG
jgi:hypothetical protein